MVINNNNNNNNNNDDDDNNNNNNIPNILKRQAQCIFDKLNPKEVNTGSADWRLERNKKTQ
jgi:hypothetical protein